MSGGWEFLLDVAAKGTVVLGAAFLGSLLLRRASASTRHLLWTLALASVLLLPVLSGLLPDWEAPVLPRAPEVLAGPGGAVPLDRAPATPNWPKLAAAVWAGGALLILARLLLGMARLRRVARRALSVEDPEWLDLLEESSRRLKIVVAVRLLESREVALPMTWGLRRPVVLLPGDVEQWPRERRQVVLVHELAHVKRRDCLTQILAQAACALHWFNPLAWAAARRCAIERERACDDRVLEAGTRASEYAGHLLDMARLLHYRQDWALAAVAMARRSHFEGRLVAILDPGLRRARSRRAAVLTGVVLAAVAFPLAAMRPWPPTAGVLSGVVYDGTYAVVPGAQVVLTDRARRVERRAVTDGEGAYSFGALPAGRYDWEVRARGFMRLGGRDIVLDAGSARRLDAVLRLGMVRETIEVRGTIPPGPDRGRP
ncbi:MAG: hypothetical protein FJW34_05560 [Acidobacteria bacterium]|nr:hypothetical protein [Acidobacteriota bacterium]